MSRDRDLQVVEQLLRGEPDSVTLVRGWVRASLTGYRNRLGGEVEDVEQQVMMELVENLRQGRFRGESALKTYVRTHCHHRGIDALRSTYRREIVHFDFSTLSTDETATGRLMRRDQRALALRVIQEMPDHCRELWQLVLDGLSYAEMSRRLGVSEGALRVRVQRCRSQARAVRDRLCAGERSALDRDES